MLAFLSVWTFLVPTLAYATGRPEGFAKRMTGNWKWNAALSAPFLLLSALLLVLHKRTSRENPVDEIMPGLFLGRRMTGREFTSWVVGRGKVSVLDVTSEFSEPRIIVQQARAWKCVPMLDGVACEPGDLCEAIVWAREQVSEGPVYVHCALGHGRSATVCAALLVSLGVCDSIEAADRWIRERRPAAGPSSAQLRSAALALRLLNADGRPERRANE
jgi:protein-tyrosine phosphatase